LFITTAGISIKPYAEIAVSRLKKIRDAGGHTIAESEDSAVVYGMPRAAVQKDAVVEVIHLDKIGPRLVELSRTATGLKNYRSGDTKGP